MTGNERFFFSDLYTTPSDREAVAVVFQEQALTYGELERAVLLCAGDLYRLGVRPGDHVALRSCNSSNWLIAFFAIVRLGGVAVLINYGLPVEYAAPLLRFTEVSFLVNGLSRDGLSGEALASAAGISGRTYEMWSMDYAARVRSGEAPEALPPEDQSSRRTAVIIFTSGTTAEPKAVMLSQYGILQNAAGWTDHVIDRFFHDSICIALPLFHSYGITVTMGSLLRGKTVYYPTRLKPEDILAQIKQYKIRYVGSVGTLYLGMLQSPRFRTDAAPFVRVCIVGGEFTSPEQLLRVHEAYPDVTFFVGYGQTEASPVITLTHPLDSVEKRAYTVGKPLSGISLRVVGQDGETLTGAEDGEILVKGPNLMNGYYGLPPEKQAIDRDGWLHTGDLGHLDGDGYLHLTGRLKDIIIKNGENISPAEIERALCKCTGIREAKVLGIPHPISGEEIVACVTAMDGFSWDEEALRTELRQYLTHFKLPAHFLLYDAFPVNAGGKLDVPAIKMSAAMRLRPSDG